MSYYRSTGCANRLTRLHNVKVCDRTCVRSKLFFVSVVAVCSLLGLGASLRCCAAHSAPFQICCAILKWWSQTGSNRRPHACKARALPTELWPRSSGQSAVRFEMVGLGRLELPTSRLSSARSNQLSYKPDEASSSGSHAHSRANHDGKEGKRRRRPGGPLCLMSMFGKFS